MLLSKPNSGCIAFSCFRARASAFCTGVDFRYKVAQTYIYITPCTHEQTLLDGSMQFPTEIIPLLIDIENYLLRCCCATASVQKLLLPIDDIRARCQSILSQRGLSAQQGAFIRWTSDFFLNQFEMLRQAVPWDESYCANEMIRQLNYKDRQTVDSFAYVCANAYDFAIQSGISEGQAFDFLAFHLLHNKFCNVPLARAHLAGFLSEKGALPGGAPSYNAVTTIEQHFADLNALIHRNRENGNSIPFVLSRTHCIRSDAQVQMLRRISHLMTDIFLLHREHVQDILRNHHTKTRQEELANRHIESDRYIRAKSLQHELSLKDVTASLHNCVLCVVMGCDTVEHMLMHEEVDTRKFGADFGEWVSSVMDRLQLNSMIVFDFDDDQDDDDDMEDDFDDTGDGDDYVQVSRREE